MFQIGEFSRLVRVSPRMLRHYEKCGLIYPAKVESASGYRLYSAAQIALLGRIVLLRDMGFSIDEIGDVLPHFDDAGYMRQALEAREKGILGAIDSEREKLKALGRIREIIINKENLDMNDKHEVILKELPPVKVLSLRETIPTYADEGMLWQKMGKFMAQNRMACPEIEESGYSIYHDADYKETDVDVEIAVPIESPVDSRDGFVYKELAAVPLSATLRFDGPYEGASAATEKLAKWVEQNGYSFAGTLRGCAIRTSNDQSDPNNYLTELQVPVTK